MSDNAVLHLSDTQKEIIEKLIEGVGNIQVTGDSDSIDIKNLLEDIPGFVSNGFFDIDDIEITYSGLTVYVNPTGSSFKFVCNKTIFTKTTSQSVAINTLPDWTGTSADKGLWYIYFDGTGTLTGRRAEVTSLDYCIVAYVYFDTDTVSITFFSPEYHHAGLPNFSQESMVNALGAQWNSGLFIGANPRNSPNADNRNTYIGLTEGKVIDADKQVTITDGTGSGLWEQDLGTVPMPTSAPAVSDAAKIPIWFATGSASSVLWKKKTADQWTFHYDSAVNQPYYNYYDPVADNWSLAYVTHRRYFVVWLFATGEKDEPIIGILHHEQYNTRNKAVDGAFPSTIFNNRNEPITKEFKLLYRIIYRYRSNWPASCQKTTIIQIDDYRSDNGSIGSIVTANLTADQIADGEVKYIPKTFATEDTDDTIDPGDRIIANNDTTRLTMTLPTTSEVGDEFEIVGKGAAGWKIAQNTGQIIHYGTSSTTTGTSGYIQSSSRYDCVSMVCVVADTEWVVYNSIGSITVV